MAHQPLLTAEEARKLLDYNPLTGALTWKPRDIPKSQDKGWNKRYAGKEAGYVNKTRGRRYLKHGGLLYSSSRVAFLIAYGRWPTMIDHINGDPIDDRLCNLREVTPTENARNQALRRDNKSGCTGVYWRPKESKWLVQIWDGNRRRHVGQFADKAEAVAARLSAVRALGYHDNHGARRRQTGHRAGE